MNRTNEDKRQAVLTLLKDEEWSKWGNREIAKACHVSYEMVRQVRATVTTVVTVSEPEKRKFITSTGKIAEYAQHWQRLPMLGLDRMNCTTSRRRNVCA